MAKMPKIPMLLTQDLAVFFKQVFFLVTYMPLVDFHSWDFFSDVQFFVA